MEKPKREDFTFDNDVFFREEYTKALEKYINYLEPKLQQKRLSNEAIFESLRKARGITKKKIAIGMDISYDTLRKYVSHPELMNGVNRMQMASILRVPVTVIDDICNGKFQEI